MSAAGTVADEARAGRRPLLLLMAPIVAAVVVLDQATKSWAVENLAHRDIAVFWTLRFNLSFNTGLAFSQGRGLTGVITVVGVLLVVGLVWWATRIVRPLTAVALALLLGGACGNLADRLLRDHQGAVIDFIDFQWFPIFNVADIAITCGAALLVVTSAREGRP